ncbi:ABC transporter ATP-binding protein [Clostridium gasigenes]|uniref:ABC transporter ATP-binding protein n=1 Tax=Clostridium gasigenes TaxID=94869 RepID=UPI0014382A76|nr:ABC transporter ATP-binding protein [Clostridium gasigenes]NKF07163.1 ABC transporter ATP-binding protein [Clostridium gasigenes]QSW18146.1 ABC transporter ATP-binding protein [Clostridium gasigenes]
MKNALEIKNLCVKNGDFELKSINLTIPKGSVMGLIGRNGVGKTTLIKAIVNQLPHSKGEVLFDGLRMYGNDEKVKSKIGVVFDDLMYTMWKPKQIVKMIAPFYEQFDINKYNLLMDKFELNPNKNLTKYSKGMKTKFNVIMALCHNPDLIILDEPTAGLDPISRAEIIDFFLEIMQDENKAILFSTHILSDLEKIADYITLMDKEKIIFSMDKEMLIEKYSIIQVDKSSISDELKRNIKGLKENIFGYQGLVEDREPFKNIHGVKFAPASIEDVMILRGGMNKDD